MVDRSVSWYRQSTIGRVGRCRLLLSGHERHHSSLYSRERERKWWGSLTGRNGHVQTHLFIRRSTVQVGTTNDGTLSRGGWDRPASQDESTTGPEIPIRQGCRNVAVRNHGSNEHGQRFVVIDVIIINTSQQWQAFRLKLYYSRYGLYVKVKFSIAKVGTVQDANRSVLEEWGDGHFIRSGCTRGGWTQGHGLCSVPSGECRNIAILQKGWCTCTLRVGCGFDHVGVGHARTQLYATARKNVRRHGRTEEQ